MNKEKFEEQKEEDFKECSGYCPGCEKFAEEQKKVEKRSKESEDEERAHEDERKLKKLSKELEEKNREYRRKKPRK